MVKKCGQNGYTSHFNLIWRPKFNQKLEKEFPNSEARL